MRRLTGARILLWLLILLILILALFVVMRAYTVTQKVQEARHLLEGNASPESARRAARLLAEAAENIPWQTDLWEQAGSAALHGADPQSAVGYFTQAESRGGLSAPGRIALGDAYSQMDDLPAAISAWESALQAGGAAGEIYSRLLPTHRSLGDTAATLSDLQALAAAQPDDASLQYQLGLLLAAQQPEAAVEHLKLAAELDPRLAASADLLRRNIHAASLADDLNFTLLEAGRGLGSLEEWELAALAFRQATLNRPDYAEAWAFLGEAIQHLPSSETGSNGLAELNKALELDPESLSAHLFLALYWQRQQRLDRAFEALQNAARLYPDNLAVQTELGKTLAMQGELQSALEAYQGAVDLAPDDATAYRQLAEFSLEHKYQVQEVALPAARRLVLLKAGDPASLDIMGQVLLSLGDASNAERYFNRALRSDPQYAPAHLHLGLIYLEQGDRPAAYEEFKLVLDQSPGTPAAELAQRLLGEYYP
jgi:tetratricopeptide (TPR) repeat protein